MSILSFFAGRAVTDLGVRLADDLARELNARPINGRNAAGPAAEDALLEELLSRAGRESHRAPLNFFQRAKIAIAFKQRLLENKIAPARVEDLTRNLVVLLSANGGSLAPGAGGRTAASNRGEPVDASAMRRDADNLLSKGANAEAAAAYRRLLKHEPEDADALTHLGAALLNLGQVKEAIESCQRAIQVAPGASYAYTILSGALRANGFMAESEAAARQALKLKPKDPDALLSLGVTQLARSQVNEAKVSFTQLLKAAPRHANALVGLSEIAKIKGRFNDAEALLKRALHINGDLPGAWATLVTLRKMTPADSDWLDRVEALLEKKPAPAEEAALRFAIGKYCDDVGDFERAFENYRIGNAISKKIAPPFDSERYARYADTLMRAYTREALAPIALDPAAETTAPNAMRSVFVVGMPRSGTSLAEQIIASHPRAAGAGELNYWTKVAEEYGEAIEKGLLDPPVRAKLADEYLRLLAGNAPDAIRIVDKAPVNSDFLGIIYSALPNTRIIYMQRDPIDSCLSCYFQKFTAAHNYATDLSDLANYYRTHHALIAHWRRVLPPGTILDVPYEELVADPEGWSRKIIDFIGLEWNARCLEFHDTKRNVATLSFWQVRQKIFTSSVRRWRHYEKFIGPLMALRDLAT